MAIYERKDAGEQPYWKLGPFKLRLPLIHYRIELPEVLQGFIIFAVGMGVIPLLQTHVGMSYEAALAVFIIYSFTMILPSLLGEPFVPGWITPAVPLVILYLGDFELGPEAVQALVALQLLVAVIFLILGVTKLGSKLVEWLPKSLKGGILIGAGLAAITGEIQSGSRLIETPITLIIGSIICFYLMFSVSFQALYKRNKWAKLIANYGIMPAIILAIIIGWVTKEYPLPNIQWGFTVPAFAEMWSYTPFVVGFPSLDVFLIAIPTAIIAYIIAYGDIIVGTTLMKRADEVRKDEKVDFNVDRLHFITFIRNIIHAFIAPHPGMSGPVFTAGLATIIERYRFGRKAMDSIFSGSGTFVIAMAVAVFLLPLVTLFQPVLPVALSLTLILTGYICITVGVEQIKTPAERGVAGIMAIVLSIYGATYGLLVGVVLYFIIERSSKLKKEKDVFDKNTKHTA
ncbi:solute carrier family 23 protein [Alkalihalobacillus sp. BA299]|uniref:solute carrier family 23 protein n=1 Tax=Alkalihalobacillus sp. BA299 TaxID=2815938 RepID=UPI001ADBB16C|nr:DUF3360 family protein [Alkalihalobacillus sp. BA299]